MSWRHCHFEGLNAFKGKEYSDDDKVNEKVATGECDSKQDNGDDVEFSMEVMVVDVDKLDSNMLMVTKLIYFAEAERKFP